MKRKAISPGKILKDLVDKYQVTLSQIAKDVGVPTSSLSQLINEKGKAGVPLALKLAKYFGFPEDYWLNIQCQYELTKAKSDPDLTAALKGIKKAKVPAPKAADAPPKRGRRLKSDEAPKEVKPSRRSKAVREEASLKEPSPRGAGKPQPEEAPSPVSKRRGRKPKNYQEGEVLETKPPRSRRSKTDTAEAPEQTARTRTPRKPRTKKGAPPEAPVDADDPTPVKPFSILIKHHDDPITGEAPHQAESGEAGTGDLSSLAPDDVFDTAASNPLELDFDTGEEPTPEQKENC